MAHRRTDILGCGLAVVAVFAAALTLPGIAVAQDIRPSYVVTGFRNVRFGLTEPEVRDLAKKEFGVGDGEMTLTDDPTSGTTTLVVHVQMLEPGLPEGRVEYLFGYREQRLFKVNVVWGVDTNPPNNNTSILDGALRLQRYFLGFNWALGTVANGIPLGERSLLLFSGFDGHNGTVTLVIENVLYERYGGVNIRMVPEISTGTRITIGYIDVSRDADRRRTIPNQF